MDKLREGKIRYIMTKIHPNHVLSSSEPEVQAIINSVRGTKHPEVKPVQMQSVESKPIHTPQDGATVTIGKAK